MLLTVHSAQWQQGRGLRVLGTNCSLHESEFRLCPKGVSGWSPRFADRLCARLAGSGLRPWALCRTFDHGWVVCPDLSVFVLIGLHAVYSPTGLLPLGCTVSVGFILAPLPYRMVNAGSCDYKKKQKKKISFFKSESSSESKSNWRSLGQLWSINVNLVFRLIADWPLCCINFRYWRNWYRWKYWYPRNLWLIGCLLSLIISFFFPLTMSVFSPLCSNRRERLRLDCSGRWGRIRSSSCTSSWVVLDPSCPVLELGLCTMFTCT